MPTPAAPAAEVPDPEPEEALAPETEPAVDFQQLVDQATPETDPGAPARDGAGPFTTKDLEALAARHLDPDALAYLKGHLQGYFKGVTSLDQRSPRQQP